MIGKAIYSLLTDQARPVGQAIGIRCYPLTAPQGSAYPCITYEPTSPSPSDTKSGPSQLDMQSVEIVIYSRKYSECETIANDVRTMLDRFFGTVATVGVQSIQFTNQTTEHYPEIDLHAIVQMYNCRIQREGEVYQGKPVVVTDGDGTEVTVQPGGTYSCIPTTAPTGIFYQRQVPWDGNDPGIDHSVAWHIANGTYNYTPPTNPASIAALPNDYIASDDRALLLQNNKFGNKYRFTNDIGEQFVEGFAKSADNSSARKRMCLDHLSGLAYYVEDAYNDLVNRTITQAIGFAKNFTYAGHSDWRLADAAEYLNAVNYNDWNNSYQAVYAPFVDNNIRYYGGSLWLGSYTKDNQFAYLRTNGGTISLTTSTTLTMHHLLLVRNFHSDE